MQTHRQRFRQVQGFSLLELMGSLAIAILIIGTLAVAARTPDDEKHLETPLENLKELAKMGWMRAVGEQNGYEIEFRSDQLTLRPRTASRQEDQALIESTNEKRNRGSGVESYPVANAIIYIKHFGEEKWRKIEGDVVERWIFEPSGICEPIQFRVETDIHWLEVQFDPLTASVQYQNHSL
jgi:hypothetical protein